MTPLEMFDEEGPDLHVEVAPSAASELSWLQHSIGEGHSLPDWPRLAALRAAAPQLATELRELWQDGYVCLAELSILAERLGVLLHDRADRLIDRLPEAARADGAGLELRSEKPDEREAIVARLRRLRTDPGLVVRYQRVLERIWGHAQEEWEAAGRRAVEHACRAWSQRLRQGAELRELLPEKHILNRPEHGFDDLLALRGRIVMSPIHFCRRGGFLVDMTSYVHIGGPAGPVDSAVTRRQEAERVAGRLKVLADGTRVALLRQLVDQPASVMDLARRFALAQPTVSNHVRLLRDAGLLEARRDGARVVYSAPRERVTRLLTETQSLLLDRQA